MRAVRQLGRASRACRHEIGMLLVTDSVVRMLSDQGLVVASNRCKR